MNEDSKFYSGPERRGASRYAVSLRMEIWPEDRERPPEPKFVNTRDVSLRGIYYLCETERPIGSKMNFSLIFLREFCGEDADLIRGIGRVVRCDSLASRDEGPRFGVAVAIEKTTHLHGE